MLIFSQAKSIFIINCLMLIASSSGDEGFVVAVNELTDAPFCANHIHFNEFHMRVSAFEVTKVSVNSKFL